MFILRLGTNLIREYLFKKSVELFTFVVLVCIIFYMISLILFIFFEWIFEFLSKNKKNYIWNYEKRKYKFLVGFPSDVDESFLFQLYNDKYSKYFLWSKKYVRRTFRYEFLQKMMFFIHIEIPWKWQFSWNLDFFICIIWMSSFKYEFLHMKTHLLDVKKHF